MWFLARCEALPIKSIQDVKRYIWTTMIKVNNFWHHRTYLRGLNDSFKKSFLEFRRDLDIELIITNGFKIKTMVKWPLSSFRCRKKCNFNIIFNEKELSMRLLKTYWPKIASKLHVEYLMGVIEIFQISIKQLYKILIVVRSLKIWENFSSIFLLHVRQAFVYYQSKMRNPVRTKQIKIAPKCHTIKWLKYIKRAIFCDIFTEKTSS